MCCLFNNCDVCNSILNLFFSIYSCSTKYIDGCAGSFSFTRKILFPLSFNTNYAETYVGIGSLLFIFLDLREKIEYCC